MKYGCQEIRIGWGAREVIDGSSDNRGEVAMARAITVALSGVGGRREEDEERVVGVGEEEFAPWSIGPTL